MLNAKGRIHVRAVGLQEPDLGNLRAIQEALLGKDGRGLSVSLVLRRALQHYRQLVDQAVAAGSIADELRAVLAVHGRKSQ